MDFCRIVDAIYRAVPLGFVRDLLIRGHMERCGRCQARLASRDEAEALFVKPGDGEAVDRLWRAIGSRARRMAQVSAKRPAGLRWEWAAGAAALLLVAAASFWLLRGVESGDMRAGDVRPVSGFEINYVNVGGAPAQAFVYQPRGSDTVFVWAGKNL